MHKHLNYCEKYKDGKIKRIARKSKKYYGIYLGLTNKNQLNPDLFIHDTEEGVFGVQMNYARWE